MLAAEVALPPPRLESAFALERAIYERRSIREFAPDMLTLEQIGQLLWAAQGITDTVRGFRAAPSAGATYPLVLYIVIPDGIFRYIPEEHKLVRIREGDHRLALARAALNQPWVSSATMSIVITARFERTTRRYGERGIRYVYMEAGHAAQNILLQAVALGLGSVPIGAFYDGEVQKVITCEEAPIYIVSVGHPR